MLGDRFKKTKYITIDQENDKVKSKRRRGSLQESKIPNVDEIVPSIPDNTWSQCPNCKETLYIEDLKETLRCCPTCDHHMRLSAMERLSMLVDGGQFKEWYRYMKTKNVIGFPGYENKLDTQQVKTGMREAVLTGRVVIGGQPCAIGIMDSGFLMGSMGQIVGEKIAKTIDKATKLKLPVILFCASGGARMQEGIVSLMQMAKTSAALARHSEAGLLYISVLTDPTTGGVTASFAMLGDIIMAEPGALIGFAGPRVIEETIRQKLPDGFQRSEFLQEKGFIDLIVERKDMKSTLEKLLRLHAREA